MTSKERAQLRAMANTIEPIIQIGKDGIGDNLITQIDDALDARNLIKIRVHLETSPKSPKDLANEIAPRLNADVVQVIGGIIVLYRETDPKKIEEKKRLAASGKAKAKVKKKVRIKGKRQRQREKEEKNPYAVYDRPRYRSGKK